MNKSASVCFIMIQRIQTLHLIAVVLLGILTIALNLAGNADCAFAKTFSGNMTALGYAYLAIIGVASALALWSIFLFHTRMRQLKMVGASTLLFILACAVFAVAYIVNMGTSALNSVAIYLPVAAIVFCVWARKRIRYDENLVRSADRLR